MKLAAVGSESIIGNVQQNLSSTILWVEKLNKKGANFILFPELNLSGYTKDIDILENVLSQKELVFQKLIETSLLNKAAFAVGFPEKAEDKYFISHFLFYKGKLEGIHRKTHLKPNEKAVFTEGKEIKVFNVGKLSIGFQLCYETHFPEISYIQEKKGANVLAMAFASPKENAEIKLERFKRYLPARAYDNSCFIVACNLNGEPAKGLVFPPLAFIVNPKGEVIVESTPGSCITPANLEQISEIRQSRMAYFNKWKRTNILAEYYGVGKFKITEE